jgi:ABC-type multidrug transport system ATPase subunit
VAVGYFAQDHHELLTDPKLTPLAFVWDACPAEPTTYVRGQLGRMLFSGDEVEKSVAVLSGGEAARVIFARLSVERPNVLVLDEPTNHLDLETIDALADALIAYEGTLIFVSHDRHFVSRIATRVIELRADGYQDFPGTYDEYLARDGADHLDVQAVVLKAKAEQKQAAAAAPQAATGELSREEKKKRENRKRQLPKKRDELLAAIEKLEEEKAQIAGSLSDPAALAPADFTRLGARHAEIEEQVTTLMNEWESVETELASLN